MKNIAFILGLAALVGLSSCEEKEMTTINAESQNGTLKFNLSTENISGDIYELLEENDNKTVETLEYDSPDYGISIVKKYYAEVSYYEDFPADKSILLKNSSSSQSYELNTKEFNKAINVLYEKGVHPDLTQTQKIYVRMTCVVSNATSSPVNGSLIVKPATTNPVELLVKPYILRINPQTYYIVGVAGWDNSVNAIGSELIPLSVKAGYEYDPLEGTGEFVYTGYFTSDMGFKVVATPGSWDVQWGADATGNLVFNDGGSSNISVDSDGYYQVSLNTETNQLTILPIELETEPETYDFIDMTGDFNGWASPGAIFTETKNTGKFTWYTDVTLDTDGGVKFRANGDWGVNWGGDSFPFATEPSGGNIPAEKGSYRVVFNQLDGCYMFFKK